MRRITVDEHTVLRFAEETDTPLLLEFVRALAEYEHLLDQVEATEEGLRVSVFREKRAEVIFCEYDGSPAGFVLFFHNYSTFLGRPGIYIEDIFVKSGYRGRGLGKLLLRFVAGIAVERNCGRLEWACLDWNDPSVAFYKSQGARPLAEWTAWRVTGDALRKLAFRPESL